MRWEDERYVRVYTRDTAELLALGWEARALLWELFRKVDRAGLLPLGKTGVRGLAAVTGLPVDVTERALPLLLEDGCVRMVDGVLVVPNFIAAQETPQSDRARQREKRERDRSKALVTNRDHESQNVTPPSQNVTESHALSRAVTPSHALSLRAVPCHADPPVGPPMGGDAPGGDTPVAQKPADPLPLLDVGQPKRSARKRAASARPDGWAPNAAHEAKGRALGVDVDAEAVRFADHHDARGSVFADWDAAFRTWITNEAKWRAERGGARAAPIPDARPLRPTPEGQAKLEAMMANMYRSADDPA